jgi:hypothetical protein
MTANKLRTVSPHFISVCLLTASLDHFQVLDIIFRGINVQIICRKEWILKTYSKAMLLLTERMNLFNSAMIKNLRLMWSYNENCKLNIRRPSEVAFELHPHISPCLIYFLHTLTCLMYCTWYQLN